MPGVLDADNAGASNEPLHSVASLLRVQQRVVAPDDDLHGHRQTCEVGVHETRDALHPWPEVAEDYEQRVQHRLGENVCPAGYELEGLHEAPPAEEAQQPDLQQQPVILASDSSGGNERKRSDTIGAADREVKGEPSAE